MPPSPQEIKLRLDSAVDEEGNVLNMAVVLEVVTVLEKIPISKEALETTRIGRIINLMRKKTNNEDLAKRAKKLVKKWQKLVSNHFKNLKSTDSPQSAGETGRLTPTINGVVKASSNEPVSEGGQKIPIDVQRKTSLKRKRTENCQVTLAPENHTSDGRETPSENNAESHLPLQQNNGAFCPQQVENLTATPSLPLNAESTITVTSDSLSENNILKIERDRTKEEVRDCYRTTEERSLSCINIPEHDTSLPVSIRTELKAQDTVCEPSHQLPLAIEPEDFGVRREPLPERHIDPYCEADGVSGCYHNGRFYHWTEVISRNEGQLTILPYVNLE